MERVPLEQKGYTPPLKTSTSTFREQGFAPYTYIGFYPKHDAEAKWDGDNEPVCIFKHCLN